MKAAYHPDQVVATVSAARWQYVTVFLCVLTVTYGFFLAIDFVPEKPEDAAVAEGVNKAPGAEIAYAASGSSTAAEQTDTNVSTSSAAVDTATEETVVAEQEVSNTEPATASVTSPASQPVTTPDPPETTSTPPSGALPVRIEIDALDRVVPVLNPTSRRVSDLDAALLSGVVRHPDAANFNQEGNMFILGHSSRLPNVINKNFQAFNDIETLRWGDTIRVYSADMVYVYRVEKVYEAKASTASVPIAGTGKMLTLATCNSFGSVDDRHIVEAKLVSQQPL